jgi:hypothetical protein
MMVSFCRAGHAVSVIIMVWFSEQWGFAVCTFFENGRLWGVMWGGPRTHRIWPFVILLVWHLKEKGFKHQPHTLENLKERIREEIGAIPLYQWCLISTIQINQEIYYIIDKIRFIKIKLFKTLSLKNIEACTYSIHSTKIRR